MVLGCPAVLAELIDYNSASSSPEPPSGPIRTAHLLRSIYLHVSKRMLRSMLQNSTVARWQDADASARANARKQIRKLLDALTAQRDADAAFVREALPLLLKRINTLPPSLASYSSAAVHTRSRGKAPLGAYDASTPSVEAVWRSIFELRRSASLEACTSLLHIFCLLISSCGETDVLVLNPFLSLAGARETLDLVVAAILRTTRVGQINRCAHEARGLMSLLVRDDVDDTAGDEAASAIALKAEALAEQLLTRRHYTQRLEGVGDHCDEDGHNKPLALYDPRFLLFEFTHNIVLRAAQVCSSSTHA
eukprot:scaffold133291_cov31-Tisochrysis_lutea.AAC.7